MYGHGDDLWRFNGASVGMGGHCLHSSRSDLIKVWEVFCKKPWSRMGSSPKCTVTETISGDSTEHQLAWEATVFIALDPGTHYRLRVRRPSDFISFKATFEFLIAEGEVKKLVYQSPMISFMAGTILPEGER